MKSHLYLHDLLRKYYKSEIHSFVEVLNKKLFPAFLNIEAESDDIADEYYEAVCQSDGIEDYDLAEAAEVAFEKGLDHYLCSNLVKYEFTAMSIATLYILWEQQVRRFLYREMRHTFEIDFTRFCTKGIKEIKDYFAYHNLNIESLQCWDKIDELRLLCNIIKHGDGTSADQLLAKNSNLFKPEFNKSQDGLPLETTLLEETLNISQDLFNDYASILISFWNELPERAYSL